MRNIADDGSMKDLTLMKEQMYYLSQGIESRMKRIVSLSKKIESEEKRLTAQGYDMKEIKLFIIKGKEE